MCTNNDTGVATSDSGIWRSPNTRRGGMLKHHSIRVKLFFGVVTLAVTIVALTAVGLVGFYRYRSLADAISTRATELPMATDLNQWAATARDANTSICLLKASEGMIDSSLLSGSDLRLQRSLFEHSMIQLTMVLERYAAAIGMDCSQLASLCPEDPDSPPWAANELDPNSMNTTLIDSEEQRASLAQIGLLIEDIDRLRRDPRSVGLYRHSAENGLSGELKKLVEETRAHLDLMHSQMSQFSHEVRGQHQVGIAMAWTALIIAGLITAAMVWFFKIMVIEPFSNLVVGARLVARGQFEHRIDLGSEDEIGELADILNQMTENFQGSMDHIQEIVTQKDEEVKIRSREVIRNEQLAGVGFLAAGFAHEINNPLAAIAWSAESLESRMSDLAMLAPEQRMWDDEMSEDFQENLQRIQGEAFRCKSITERMLSYSRVGHVERESIELAPIVRDVVDMVSTIGKYQCTKIDVASDVDVTAHANSQEIRQVVLNLVTNAMESVDDQGRVDVAIANDGDNEAVIRVTDTGCGMTHEVMQHLFEPFYTRRRDGTGTGLGLSISYRIISQHGGQLQAYSEGEGSGSTFEIRLPVAPISQDELPNDPKNWKWRPRLAEAA